MADLTFKQLTGLNSEDNIELGLGRLDIAPYGSNNLLPVGALEGTATVSFNRTAVDVKAGSPQVIIKKIINEEGADMKVTLLETSAKRVHEMLGLPGSSMVEIGGKSVTVKGERVHISGVTPSKLDNERIASAALTVVANTPMNLDENVGTTNGAASQAFTVANSPILNNVNSLFLKVGSDDYTVLVADTFPLLFDANVADNATTLSLAAQPKSPSRLRVSPENATAWGTIILTGKDALSQNITETLTFTSNAPQLTTKVFASVDANGIAIQAAWSAFDLDINGPDQKVARVATGDAPSQVILGDNLNATIPAAGVGVLMSYRSKKISSEELTKSDGTASQTRTLKFFPITNDSQTVTVAGEVWSEVAAFTDQLATAKVYTINNTTGLMTFGNGVNGAIPGSGASMFVAYRPVDNVYVDGTDYLLDTVGGYLMRLPAGGMKADRDYSITYPYTGITSSVVTFGGHATVQNFHVMFTHPMLNGKFEITEFYKAVPQGNYSLAYNLAAVNSREFMFTALADLNRPKGDNIARYAIQDASPF